MSNVKVDCRTLAEVVNLFSAYCYLNNRSTDIDVQLVISCEGYSFFGPCITFRPTAEYPVMLPVSSVTYDAFCDYTVDAIASDNGNEYRVFLSM